MTLTTHMLMIIRRRQRLGINIIPARTQFIVTQVSYMYYIRRRVLEINIKLAQTQFIVTQVSYMYYIRRESAGDQHNSSTDAVHSDSG